MTAFLVKVYKKMKPKRRVYKNFFTLFSILIYGPQIKAFAEHTSGFHSVSGPNWEFRVISIENTGKQRWKSSGPKLGKVYHIGIKEENLSFWRIKAEVKRKTYGIDFNSKWVKLTYTAIIQP